jgi:hypothetical protein
MKQQSVLFVIYVVLGICCWVLFSVILCFLLNFVQLLSSFNKMIIVFCFHHPLNKQIDLMLMNFDASLLLYFQNHL